MKVSYILLTILLMFLATYPVRFLPIIWSNKQKFPKVLKVWLSFIPVTVFSALLAQILFEEGANALSFMDLIPLILSLVVTFLVTLKTKSFSLGMFVGFGIYILAVFMHLNFAS